MSALYLKIQNLSPLSIQVVPVASPDLIHFVLELQCWVLVFFLLAEFINYLLASFCLSLLRTWRFYIRVELSWSCPLQISSVLVRLLCV